MQQISRVSSPTVTRAVFFKRLAAAIILTNLFVLVLTGLSLRQSRLLLEGQAGVTAQNLAELLEQYIEGSLGKIDVTLLAAVEEFQLASTIKFLRVPFEEKRHLTWFPTLFFNGPSKPKLGIRLCMAELGRDALCSSRRRCWRV